MRRLAWWATLALAAAAAVVVQFDRASVTNPAMLLMVPPTFRSSAQFSSAGLAVATGSPAAAVREAERLVRRRPIPADHLFLLAMARLRSNDVKGFRDTFRLATTRGWRSEPVQLLAARSAIASGDAEAAANRIAALWAIGSASPDLHPLTRQLLSLPQGPEALGARIGASDVLRARIMSELPGVAPPGTVERLLRTAPAEVSDGP